RSPEEFSVAHALSVPEMVLGKGETVLVVEDEPMVRDLIVDVLGSHGYTVVSAGTPGEAERICRANPETVRLLVTDVVMPGMSGSQLAERLLELEPQMKVLYMSGYPDAAVVRNGSIGKAEYFVSKPFTVQGLLEKVREALDDSGEREGS
ncbi:MAG: response regulator, partial [candidate division KSB1 bacterium]|nr:response regulator [candidate division KSB1 bacterium]